MKRISIPILSNNELLPGVYQLIVEAPHIARIAQPGQFVMFDCGKKLLLNRPLSIHRVENSSGVSFLYRIAGKGTLYLSQMKKGEYVHLIGPLGSGFSLSTNPEDLLLVAGGIGIAPLVFLADRALSTGKYVRLLLGASTASQLYPRHLLPHISELVTATEDGSDGIQGMITNLFPGYVENADKIFICGPVAMYKAIYKIVRKRQLQKEIQVSLEVRMGCGMGICYGCSIRTINGMRMVCHEGPVFNFNEVLWEEGTL